MENECKCHDCCPGNEPEENLLISLNLEFALKPYVDSHDRS